MPKLIAPRRTNKNVTVDQFWEIRSKFTKSEEPVEHNYRENEVAKRHRFMRLRDQIKTFNPLEYYLSKDQDFASEHKTHTHAYLQSIAYRLPEEIMTVKSLMFGLASILQNIGQIYTTLWDHLDSDDCWKLIRALLKDTREESYRCWINEGLQKIVGGLGNDFKESRFKNIFNTLCLLMEVCFDKISENEDSVFEFLEILGQFYFRNKNKYIRKFSLKCISYVMSNIEEEVFYKFVTKMTQNKQNELYQHFGDILSQRLKYSDGCLTPNSLQEMITLVERLKQINIDETILTIFVHKVLANLQEKRNHEQNQTLFDLTYIIKAFIELGNNNKLQPQCIISGIDQYLHQTINEKHAKPRRFQQSSLQAISHFLWENLAKLSQSESTYNMLALSFKVPLSNINNIRDFLLQQKDEDLVLNFLSLIDEGINKEISMLLISSFKNYLETLLCQKSQELSESNILIAYKIFLLSKKHSISLNLEKMFSKTFDLKKSINQLIHHYKAKNISNERLYEQTLVFLRILTIIELPKSLKPVLVQLLNETVQNYYEVLKGYFKQVDSASKNLFDGRRYVEQIFLYSHSTIPIVWQGFNVIQSFIEIQKKIGENIIDRNNENYSLWQKIVVNRVSICNEIQNVLSQGKNNYLFALQSRHRQIRFMTLQHLKENKIFGDHEFMLQKILNIDEDIVDLETQRTVKMMLLEMVRYLQKNQLPTFLNQIILCWSLGFAFTGMKTIEESFANFLSTLLEIQQNIKFETLVNFIEYYTFRNSRVYSQEIQKFYADNDGSLQISQIFKSLTNQDFENSQIETTEFIGVDRVALAISKSQKVKTRLGSSLINILDQYFNEEFIRHKTVLCDQQTVYKSENGQVNQLLQPPKTTFLKQILKLVPSSYQPPLQCLHYTKQYLKLESVLKIKRQQWQVLWDKKTKFEHNRIMFENMSHKQMQMYIHFLWGELLNGDANKLRIIIQHIRDYMNQKVGFFVELYFKELTLGVNDQEKLKKIFWVMDSRKLLTFIYVLKAIVKALRNYVRDHFDRIIQPLMIMMEMLEPSVSTEMEDEGLEQQNQEEGSQANEDEIAENPSNSGHKKFKNHRKQIYKILNSLVTLLADQMPISSVDHILEIFDRQNKLQTFGKVSLNSTPGLLIFLKQLSKYKKYHSLFMKYKVFEQLCIIFKGISTIGVNSSLNASVEILRQVLGIKKQNQISDEKEESQECVIKGGIEEELLNSIYDFLASFNKFGHELTILILQIVLELSKISSKMSQSWQKYLLLQINRIVIMKTSTESNKTKLFHLIRICLSYSKKMVNNEFLLSMMVFIPQLKQIQHRKLIANSISQDIQNNKQKTIRNIASNIVTDLNSTIDGGLIQQIDFPAFFKGTNSYKDNIKSFNIQQQEFIIYNLLAYVTSPELSVRKAVQTCLQQFLSAMHRENRDLVSKLFRIVSEQLKKPYNGQEHIFWGIFVCLGFFTRWVIKNDLDHAKGYQIFGKSVSLGEINDSDIFQQFSAIAQSKKMEGLKALKTLLKNEGITLQNRIGDKYPNILTGIFLPVLQHFILPPPTFNSKFEMVSNLTTSLSHVSLEVYEFAMKRGGESLQKKQLKRMVAKLKFDEQHMKKNVTIVKIISQITESINLPKVSETITKTIKENGMEEFHKKLVEKKSRKSNIRQVDEDDSEDEILKRKAFTRINNQIEDDQLINMGFLNLDKKIMQYEDEENPIDIEEPMVKFLKTHVLSPLKTMLMFENKNKKKNSQEESDKSRMFLSIVVTKIIMRFPVEIFMNELQKIISRLGRLLKQREIQIRENARKCFAEIAKLIGADMLYIIFREFKFHLRDNFQNHILNYSIYYVLQKFGPLENGSIDYCLPIILPSIVDELFGKSGAQKEMVDEGFIPVINMESRKKKANDLLIIVCKQISVQKIDYLVKYFDKFLLEYINSQANISKYEQMLTNLIGGLSKNDKVMDVSNSNTFIETLHESIEKLKNKIKLYQFEDPGFHHESNLKQNLGKGKKTGKEALQIQEQAGRNASIFRKQAKQIQERRNNELLVGCFMQFYLSLLSLLIKKKIINEEQQNEKFDSIITFIVECVSHRDNRIVHRCLKVIHNVIHWKKMKSIMQIRKKTSRKIFGLIQKLTSADEDLIRQCFTILNDLFQQINITSQVLQVLLTIIKLHITTVEKTIAEQPYKLLKTVLVKISNQPHLILDNAVYELYEYSRATLISTSLDHIRNVCREICSIYIKQQKQHDVGGKKNKSQTHVRLDFNQEVSFYLNNIDCKWSQTQSAILDVLKTYVQWHSKPEIEQTGQVIIMSLGAAYANDQDNHSKLAELIKLVSDKIDNSKVLSLMEKCLIWSSNNDQEAISVCGFFILSSLLKAKGSLLNESKLAGIAQVCGQVLLRQENNLLIYEQDMKQKQTQYETLKNNPEWEGIIQVEDVHLKVEKNYKSATQILVFLMESHNVIKKREVELLWKLVSAPSQAIHSKAGEILLKLPSITKIIGEPITSANKEEDKSIKIKILQFVKSAKQVDSLDYAIQIANKVIQETKEIEGIVELLESLILGLINRISKSILNLKKNDKTMRMAIDMLTVVLSVDKNLSQRIIANEKIIGEIFWNVAKINRNQLVDISIKEKNEAFGEVLKQLVGQGDFYRRLSSVEVDRKQKKAETKAEMLKLAITDQQAYGLAKAKKKHKKG